MADEEIPNAITKAVEANKKAEEALAQETPDIALAQAWAAVAANWSAMVDPRSADARRLLRGRS